MLWGGGVETLGGLRGFKLIVFCWGCVGLAFTSGVPGVGEVTGG